MATECDVSKSRRFDLGMSRRTRRSTSLVGCYQGQHVPPLTRQLRQDESLKTLFQCQDTELQPPYPYEDQELGVLQEPLQCEGDEQKTPNQCLDEQEKKLHHYLDEEKEEEKKPHQHQDGERKTPDQYHDQEQKTLQQCQDEEKTPLQYQDEEKTPNEYEDEENAPGKYEDEEQKTAKQHQEEEEDGRTSETNQDEEHKSLKARKHYQDTEQKATGQHNSVKKLITPPPCAGDVPRFSLQELIQEKQLLTGEAKAARKLGHGEKTIADHSKISPAPAASGGATLAIVIKRPDGGKKSMGVIRRCVKALNQMVKAKHGSKKKTPFY
ncbi:hypothetical protein GUJ93_ZPchr0013g37157 [Zizania palustris]|uniref:Uncharacterized protein n=1 Tax=Zizania palustris TaxID=103762 RepID=A0A8J6C4S6_ZIZPA|nr:hypothetical protein GUJ93_ZPchr0013g37157 [Zizania palustris]